MDIVPRRLSSITFALDLLDLMDLLQRELASEIFQSGVDLDDFSFVPHAFEYPFCSNEPTCFLVLDTALLESLREACREFGALLSH